MEFNEFLRIPLTHPCPPCVRATCWLRLATQEADPVLCPSVRTQLILWIPCNLSLSSVRPCSRATVLRASVLWVTIASVRSCPVSVRSKLANSYSARLRTRQGGLGMTK